MYFNVLALKALRVNSMSVLISEAVTLHEVGILLGALKELLGLSLPLFEALAVHFLSLTYALNNSIERNIQYQYNTILNTRYIYNI